MIEIELTHTDLTKIRFDHSPLLELLMSLRALRDAPRNPMHRRWHDTTAIGLSSVRGDLPLLLAVSRRPPKFLLPALGDSPSLEEELHAVAGTPPPVVRAQLRSSFRGQTVPTEAQSLLNQPESQLPQLTALLQRYWTAAIAPAWPRICDLRDADVAYRLRQLAAHGLARMVDGLHPDVVLNTTGLHIGSGRAAPPPIALHGDGLRLMPSAFSWPNVRVTREAKACVRLCYPMRDLGSMSLAGRSDHPAALSAVLGTTRTTLLYLLKTPTTTTDLAGRLDISPAAVSQHLKILKQARLAESRRRGRHVFYQRTATATVLLAPGPDAALDRFSRA